MSFSLPPRPGFPTPVDPSSREVTATAGIDDDVASLMDLSPLALMIWDEAGNIQRANGPARSLLGPHTQQMNRLPSVLAQLLGWPNGLPGAGRHRESQGWMDAAAGRSQRMRVRVRGLAPQGGMRWMAQLESMAVVDELELARVEIGALMGTAGVGVATYDRQRRVWVTAVPPGAGTTPSYGPGSGGNASSGNEGLLSIGRDVVEPASMPAYERLQLALRKGERISVRYAVRHRDMGRRWLLTRVEPARLGPERPVFSVVTLDVTEEEVARERRDALLREMQTILDLSPAGIAHLQGQRLLHCNREFENLLKLAPAAGEGVAIDTLLARVGISSAATHAALDELVRQGHHETEFRLEGEAGGAAVWYSLALRRAEGQAGEGEDSADIVAVLADVTRLRGQQAELEELARERELMFSLSDVGIFYQRDGRIERANQAMADLLGHEQSQLRGFPLAELYEDERVALQFNAHDRRELAAQGRSRSERRILRRDGSPLWVLMSQRLVDAADISAGVICSVVSVDERRRAHETLLMQADSTRAILDSVLVGIVTVGDDGIEWMNRSARRMFGGELADFVGKPIAVVASQDADHPLRRTNWMATLEEGQAETFECRLTARDGREFWVVGNALMTTTANGGNQLTFALLDIERRRLAENQIAQAQASLQRMIETAPLAIALFDGATQQVLQLNQMMAAFARRQAAEIQGRQPSLWLPGAEAANLSANLHRAMATHDTLSTEWRREPDADGDGSAKVWDVRIVSLRSSGDDGEQLLLVASDVTEQRAADQARLDAAIVQREMLVKEVHHRIKNNLQGVAGLLQQNAQRHPEAASAIAEAVGHVHAIAQVHGLQVGMTGPLRVRGVVEAIANSVQRMFGRPITMEVQGPAPHRFGLTEADSIPVALTVNELLTNAIKHSREGVIQCRMICGPQDVRIAIANDGALPPGFSLGDVPSGISGLGLVRALLPRKGAGITLTQEGLLVVATLHLQPPGVAVLEPL
ncbi:PAS domain-containing sensor histidine kinase [Ideonella margarita]|uniref:PAS domain S-box protein n=1 Tax=Ideonella margarita TaxID=2984191 RepID=A0ABU9C922_9BURK